MTETSYKSSQNEEKECANVEEHPAPLVACNEEFSVIPLGQSQNNLRKRKRVGQRHKKQGGKNLNLECSDVSRMTLWDLVMKNRRVTCSKKSKMQKTLDGNKSFLQPQETLLDTFLGDTQTSTLHSSSHSLDFFQELFEPSDKLMLFQSKTDDSNSQDDLFCGNKELRGSLRLDEEGNLLLEEPLSSLGRTDHGPAFLMEGRVVVDENYNESRIIQPYHGAYKRSKAVKWMKADEDTFYEALETFGLDLMMVRTWLPHFSARQIKDKYHVEERRNAERIEQALRKRRPITVKHFESIHGEIDERTHFRPAHDSYSDSPCSEDATRSSPVLVTEDFLMNKLFRDDLFDENPDVLLRDQNLYTSAICDVTNTNILS